jgi:dTDP-4-amino-4,6-dideoxygalactose transaminase
MRKFPKRSIYINAGEPTRIFELARSGELLRGGEIERFERAMAEFTGAGYAAAAGSGRCALSLILKAGGLRAGDEIIVCAYNYPGLVAALLKENYRVVPVDAGPGGFQMDASGVESSIGSRTRAVIATHLYGQPCDIRGICAVARRRGLTVIEDAAHSLGTMIGGRHAGTFGDFAFLSFSGSKPLNTSCGGMVLTNSGELYRKIVSGLDACDYPDPLDLIRMRLFTYAYSFITGRAFFDLAGYPASVLAGLSGWDPWVKYNSMPRGEFADRRLRFSNMQACVGLGYMDRLREILAARCRCGERLYRQLRGTGASPDPAEGSNYFMIPLLAKDRRRLYRGLLLRGIDANIGYAYDCSFLLGTKNPRAALLERSTLLLNLPFDTKDNEVDYLAEQLNALSGEMLRAV